MSVTTRKDLQSYLYFVLFIQSEDQEQKTSEGFEFIYLDIYVLSTTSQ